MRVPKIHYVADLSSKSHIQTVRLLPKEACDRPVAVLERFGGRIARFTVTPTQIKKIKRGRGRLNITQKAIEQANLWCSKYGR